MTEQPPERQPSSLGFASIMGYSVIRSVEFPRDAIGFIRPASPMETSDLVLGPVWARYKIVGMITGIARDD